MILPMQYKADWAMITLEKQKRIDKPNQRENSKRLNMEYKVGDLIWLVKPGILSKFLVPTAFCAMPGLDGKVLTCSISSQKASNDVKRSNIINSNALALSLATAMATHFKMPKTFIRDVPN